MDDNKTYAKPTLINMFNQMSTCYERLSTIGSFGLSRLWRRQAIGFLGLKAGDNVYDLMSGTGESWQYILPHIGEGGSIHAVDFSREMTMRGNARKQKLGARNIDVVEGDALATCAPAESADAVFSAYGVKTLSPELYPALVSEVQRILKPGGSVSIVEASLPENRILRRCVNFYLKSGFFILKTVFGKKADNFAMFRHYLSNFENCKKLSQAFTEAGFAVRYERLKGQGATAVVARKLQR